LIAGTALLLVVAFSELKHEEPGQQVGQTGDAAGVAGRAK